ncbi:hypothetical protein VPH35_045241 [Triticum aestivum]
MFRRSITGKPTFSLSSWFGIPGKVILLRNSVGHIFSIVLYFIVALHIVSKLRIVVLCGSSCSVWHYWCDSVVVSQCTTIPPWELLRRSTLKSFLALYVIFTKGNISNVYFREVQKISHYMKI